MAGPVTDGAAAPGAVVRRVVRRVRPGRQAAFEALAAEVATAASASGGYLGMELTPPADPAHPVFGLDLRFGSHDDLARYERSPAHRALLARIDRVSDGPPRAAVLAGVEPWFVHPARAPGAAPPTYKMAVVSALAIYPVINTVPALLAPIVGDLPEWTRTAIAVVVLTPLLTWVVMPLATRLFARWLFPPTAGS